MRRSHDVVLYGWMFILSLGLALSLVRVFDVASAATQSRVQNVQSWCPAINGIIDYQRQRVSQAQRANPGLRVSPYRLHDLPCLLLESQTRSSAP